MQEARDVTGLGAFAREMAVKIMRVDETTEEKVQNKEGKKARRVWEIQPFREIAPSSSQAEGTGPGKSCITKDKREFQQC